MKRCRNTLALVLVLALALGMLGTTAGADFTDQSEITNDEAAAVLAALGIIEGYDDGSYQPATVLTREQAAAIIARMLLGDNAEQLSAGSAPFSDVDASRWSAGYIAYCVSEGIIDGYGDGSFGPADELTAYQFAKMLLCALGYDADAEGFVGTSWAINVATYAVNAGILEDVSDYSAGVSRDTAALMALNTLVADVVYYPSGNVSIETGDGTNITINGSGASLRTNTSSSDGNIEDDGYMQFAERYWTKLERTTSTVGTYGRPATYVWTLDDDGIYSGVDDEDLLGSYTTSVTRGTVYSLIGSSAYSKLGDEAELYVYIDGELVADADVDDYIVRSSSSYIGANASDTGRGVTTEVYLTDDGDVYIVIINTYLGIAQDDYDSDSGELEVVYYYNDTYIDNPTSGDDVTLYDDDFDIDGYAADDYLLLTFDGEDVASVESAGSVSGTVTGYTSGSSVTVDGTRYYFARNIDSDTFVTSSYAINSDITLILDENGYIVGTDDATSSSYYLYLLEVAQSGSLSSSGYEAAVFFTDGTYDEISLRYIDDATPSVDAEAGWYSYTVNSAGRYTLTSASNTVETTNDVRNGYARYISGNSLFTATSSTVFIVYDVDDGDYDVYTGYSNVPNITAGSDAGDSLNVSALRNSSGYSVAVFIAESGATVSGGGRSSSDVAFVYYGGYSTSSDSDGNIFYTYYAFLNGESTTINTNYQLSGSGLYYDISYDSNGYIDDAAKADAADGETDDYLVQAFAADDAPEIAYSSGVVTVGMDGVYELADDYDIYVVDTAEADYSSVTASRLASKYSEELSAATTIYAVLDDDGYVTSMYVVMEGILDI